MNALLAGAHDGLIVVIERLIQALRLTCDQLAEARSQLMEADAAR
jgi:hypothetical protein